MHHGSGPQNAQRQLQRSRSFTGSENEDQQANLPHSPAPSFAPSASPSAPQSPSYQIQQFIMSRSPVAGQNVNITLQNVGPVSTTNQQITLTPLPIPSPTSPSFQFSPQQRRFEHGSPSYIQVTSPLPPQVQSQSPTQPSPVSVQTISSVRAGTPGPGLGMCSQSPTRGFVDASVLVRQISLSPSNGGHFVYQEGSGLTQIAQSATAQVQLSSSGASVTVRERRLSQPHSQTGGTIHHLGPQSPVTSGGNIQALPNPGHITTNNLPPQISNIIQGMQQQQQQQQGQPLNRPLGFDRTSAGLIAGVGGPAFGITSPPPPTSPSRASIPQGLTGLPLGPSVCAVVKKAKKVEEIPPATPEAAQMRKQCLEHHLKQMETLKDAFKEYLIELFFLQHLQGNMMDFLAFRKKHCLPLQAYLRQNDLDLEEEEEEEQSEVINDEQVHAGTPVAGTVNAIEIEAFKRQQALTSADSSKRARIEVGRHGMVFQHPGVASGVPLQQLMPTAQGGMPPTPQTVQLTGQKQSQQQYDPSKGPPVQNAASLHTPPPQLPGRLQSSNVPISSLPPTLQLAPQATQMNDPPVQQAAIHVKAQPQSVTVTAAAAAVSHGQVQAPSQPQVQPTAHGPGQMAPSQSVPSQTPTPQQITTLARPSSDSNQNSQRISASVVLPTSSNLPTSVANPAPQTTHSAQANRSSPGTNKSASPVAAKPPGLAVAAAPKTQNTAQNTTAALPQDSAHEKLAEQVKLENHVHQRIAELRKEGLWSLRRLPKLQEAPRPKSQWDYLLEEMQWMATDFAQERRWKMATAKKMVRTVARYHEEKHLNAERAKKEEKTKLRRIAATIAREIEYFWSNIEQVVEIKLQIEFQEKRRKALNLKRRAKKGKDSRHLEDLLLEKENNLGSWSRRRKRKASTSLTDDEVEDEEETIEEQETKEGKVNHQLELSTLAKEAELPLDDLMKMYEGAFADNFHWPKPEDEMSEEEMEDHLAGREFLPKEIILIDSLLSIEQYKGGERMMPGKNRGRDIAEVAATAEVLLPKGSARITTAVNPSVWIGPDFTGGVQVKYNTPPLLYGSLREYQKIGLDWLAKLYKKKLNGILADEAGLGKTVQIIAFFAHLACNEGDWGPHLVVVRSCNILKWELELKRWCPGLKLLLYIGTQRELRMKRQEWTEPNSFNVCITSYKQLFKGHQAFMKIRWKYLIVDEMQQIKNMTEKHWEALFHLRSQYRLLLIDTPLHNTLMELWTMVHFLIPGISKAYLDFPVKAANEENQDYCHKLVIRLHRMIQPFILRRSKRDVEKQLTKKYEHVLKCRLSNRQKVMYEDVILQPETQDALKSGHFVSVLHVLMQLQKICNHPDLINPRLCGSSYVSEALQYATASLAFKAVESNLWKVADLSLFDLIGLEETMTRYESQVVPKQKITRKLIEEIYTSPLPPPRPAPVKLKPNRLFQPVHYGQKPEGKMVAFPSTQVQRATSAATVAQQSQGRGKSPMTTVTASQAAVAVSSAASAAAPQLQTAPSSSSAPPPPPPPLPLPPPRHQPAMTFATATSPAHPVKLRGQATTQGLQLGQAQPQAPPPTIQQSVLPQRLVLTSQAQARLPRAQGRIAQPETPVTLQFQGNKFTLSHSQLRQLTAGQPLQLQGSVLQIVSAPGPQYLRPQGPVVVQTVPQPGSVQNSLNALGNQHPVGLQTSAGAQPGRSLGASLASGDSASSLKSGIHGGHSQESFEEKNRLLKERLDRIFSCNQRRCSRAPVYGKDLRRICSLMGDSNTGPQFSTAASKWRWAGFVNCRLSKDHQDPLQGLTRQLEQQQQSLRDTIGRALCVLPAAVAAPPSLHAARLPPVSRHRMKLLRHNLKEKMLPYLNQLHQLTMPRLLPFPDLRLIQYDAGKLEALAVLLQKLKSEGRRVLILSQMMLMLDILERFLNFHFLTYVRIDECANQEERQELMKTFNRDKRLFCAILSSHSRSTGVNLVEADTVVFYDNDLNPVMEAKAQEWCDRIGRCKDIHIYRLVSGNSVEEKLLKNGTKDLIREVAAQGNEYSMAFLTQQTIQELFEVHSPMEDSGFRVKAEEFVMLSQEPSPSETISPKVARPFIEALKSTEREEEEKEEKEEDEEEWNSRVLDRENESALKPLVSELGKAQYLEEPSLLKELVAVVDQLTPIEKYALNYLEFFHASAEENESKENEVEVRTAKRKWETRHLKGLKEEEEKTLLQGKEEELFTYTREDAYNKEYFYEGPDGQTEIMPLWTPPTPPQDDNDIYIDSVMCLMYEPVPIPESKLPPVYVRKERKRHKTDPSTAGRKKKQRHGEVVIPPRSLFDRATPGMLKVRREGKEQKKNILLKQQTPFAKPLPTLVKPAAEAGQDNPEWLISEDWALLQTVKQLLELPLNLAIMSPAHTPNWDLVSDVVNSCSRVYRSPKQCRNRYENVVIPREEGKLMYEANPKKKTKSIYKTKNSRPLRTNQLYAQDEGASHTHLYTNHFEIMKLIAGKRSPPIKPLLGMNPFQKNPKHTSVLAESGINYDKPLPPIQVASLRAERIAKEKKALAEQQRAQQQNAPQQQQGQQPQQQPQQSGQQTAQPMAGQQVQAQPQGQGQGIQQAQGGLQTAATTVANTAVLAGTMKPTVTGTNIQTATVSVNTMTGVPATTFQPINKRLASPIIPGALATSAAGTTTGQVAHSQQRASSSTSVTSAELVTLTSTPGVRAVTSVTASAVVTTNLTPVQTQPRSLVTQVTPAATASVQLSGKTIPQNHFQLLRQQQQQQQQQTGGQVQVPQGQGQAPSQPQIKTVGKISQEQLIKFQKQKMQATQQQAPQPPGAPGAQQQAAQVQVQQQQTQQLTAVAASRPGAVLAGTTVTGLQVARLTRVAASQLQAQSQIQAQTPQAAQVALAKPPVMSVPVVSSAGVTALPVTVSGISVAIGQPQKAAGGQAVMTQPLHVQQFLKVKQAQHHQAAQQKVIQPQVAQGQAGVQQKVTVQTQQPASQQQKVYATQPAIKAQFLPTSISQPQKTGGAQQVQTQIQVAKIPQVVSQQAAVANIQQMVSVSQQVQAQPQTVTLSQTTAGQHQVQVIPATTATAQVVPQKLIQQQVVTTASPQIQASVVPAQAPAPSDGQGQQAKVQMRAPVRLKTPNKPS